MSIRWLIMNEGRENKRLSTEAEAGTLHCSGSGTSIDAVLRCHLVYNNSRTLKNKDA